MEPAHVAAELPENVDSNEFHAEQQTLNAQVTKAVRANTQRSVSKPHR
jgi:hypothetical protein